jgi:diguanylate cyclase (GGDEF)-like protein
VSQGSSGVREIAAVQQATQMILSSLDVDSVLHQILLVVRNQFRISRCAIFLLDEHTSELYCHAQNGYDERSREPRLPLNGPDPISRAAHSRSPLYIPEVKEDSGLAEGIRCELVLPLLIRERVLGVLELASDRPEPFGNDTLSLVSVFAGQAAIALEAARLYTAERRRMRQVELLNLIARTAAMARERSTYFSTLADLLGDILEGTDIAVLLFDAERNITIAGQAGATEPEGERFEASKRRGVLQEVLTHRSSALVQDVAARQNWFPCFSGALSELAVPLVSQGEILGALVLSGPKPGFFGEEERSIAQAAADISAAAVRNVYLIEELHRIASTDPSTGAFNQRHFQTTLAQELSRSRRYRKNFGTIMLDLRKFGQVNNAVGLDRGDEIIRQVTASLQSHIRSHDTLCRYVGDRFALVLPEVNQAGVSNVIAKLQDALASIDVKTTAIATPLSAAWASVVYPQDGNTEAELLKTLLARLDQAKQPAASAGA